MPNKTQNYQLNQYQPEDNFLRTDFNEDNAKVDAALGEVQAELNGKSKILLGTYTGDDDSSRIIPLPETPKAVLLAMENGEMYHYPTTSGGIAFQGFPLRGSREGSIAMELLENGFWVTSNRDTSAYTNRLNRKYYYIAFL